jgi:hypothetical protein
MPVKLHPSVEVHSDAKTTTLALSGKIQESGSIISISPQRHKHTRTKQTREMSISCCCYDFGKHLANKTKESGRAECNFR